MIIVGVNAYHGDAAAALFIDGRCVAAAAEERFTRNKHQAGFPDNAIRWCLEWAGVRPEELDHVAVSRNPAAHIYKKVWFAARRASSMSSMVRARFANAAKILDIRSTLAGALDVDPKALSAQFHRVEHHRAHLASAFFCSPLEEAACFSVDGMGDFVSTMWGQGRGNHIDVYDFITYPHSLGVYYTAMTQFLGLPKYGDEYKLMGLSAYGEPTFLPQLRDVLVDVSGLPKLNLDYFVHHVQGVDMTWESGTPEIAPLYSPKMAEIFGPPREFRGEVSDRDRDLAASVQARLEEVELEMLRLLQGRTARSFNLVMAGGVALNCVANGMIRQETPFDGLWLQPASTDDGTAIGAALWVWHQVLGNERSWVMHDVALGAEYTDADYKQALEDVKLRYRWLPEDELVDYVASRIADGAITGWFQGRMEFGPRALGNRSIVCDPRRPDMKDILNARIKHREPFRPFAPSILAEATADWFEQDYPSPFMLMAYAVKPGKRSLMPAVTHEDGTGRLQTVDPNVSPRYHALISAFGRRTGVPVLLNTSFNENEPICQTPQEAVDCFVRTQMDLLVLGNFVAESK